MRSSTPHDAVHDVVIEGLRSFDLPFDERHNHQVRTLLSPQVTSIILTLCILVQNLDHDPFTFPTHPHHMDDHLPLLSPFKQTLGV